jgi:hypothetical protein
MTILPKHIFPFFFLLLLFNVKHIYFFLKKKKKEKKRKEKEKERKTEKDEKGCQTAPFGGNHLKVLLTCMGVSSLETREALKASAFHILNIIK